MPKGGIQRYNGAPPAAASPGQVATAVADLTSADPLAALLSPTTLITVGTLPAAAASGDVVVFEDGADAGVYICTTPYTSGGTLANNWTKVTDPKTIAIIMATAASFGAAGVAQASADGKNTIRYLDVSLLPPSATTAGVLGDTIFGISGARIVAQYKLTGISGGTYTWTSVQLDSQVIANLDVGKITGGLAAFVQARITSLSSVSITSSILSSSDGSMVINLTNGTTYYYRSGVQIAHANSTGAFVDNGGSFKISPGLLISGSQGLSVGYGGSVGTSNIVAAGNITALGDVSGAHLRSTGSATTTNAANTNMDSGGYLHQVLGSSRELKYGVEPAELDADIVALKECGLFAWHYFDDPAARCVVGPVIEEMLARGLDRYVDFDDDGQPYQPAWNQIITLIWGALQRTMVRADAQDAQNALFNDRLTALENR